MTLLTIIAMCLVGLLGITILSAVILHMDKG